MIFKCLLGTLNKNMFVTEPTFHCICTRAPPKFKHWCVDVSLAQWLSQYQIFGLFEEECKMKIQDFLAYYKGFYLSGEIAQIIIIFFLKCVFRASWQ